MLLATVLVAATLQHTLPAERCGDRAAANFRAAENFIAARQFACAEAWVEDAAADPQRRDEAALVRALLALEREAWESALDIAIPARPPRIQAALLFARGYAASRYSGRGERPALLDETRRAAATLRDYAGLHGRPHAELARVLLLASVAAAQDEREELRVLLVHAVALVERLLPDESPPILLLDPLRVVGDLWLQVDRDDEALRAYRAALERNPSCGPCLLGVARAAARLSRHDETRQAATDLLARWSRADAGLPEIAELRALADGVVRH